MGFSGPLIVIASFMTVFVFIIMIVTLVVSSILAVMAQATKKIQKLFCGWIMARAALKIQKLFKGWCDRRHVMLVRFARLLGFD